MKNFRFDPASKHPLFNISWKKDTEFRMSPEVVTTLLREQVPLLEFVDWQVTSIEPGMAESVLPLNPQSTNQHFTHQAAVFVLSADYTGGTAIASLLWGWPVIGVHPVTSPASVSLWLLKAEVKYILPSVGDLTVTAVIDEARRERIQKRFLSGKPVLESITMLFKNGDKVVAEATTTYFARQSTALRATGSSGERVNSLYELKLTSSAELIAGVRARESGTLFSDPYAEDMAGQHGMALATRFCTQSPQLGGMVAARTHHLDKVMKNFTDAGGRDIINIGVGWDMRAFRLDLPQGCRFYELDFPTTLNERNERLLKHKIIDNPGISRIGIPIDLRTMALDETIKSHVDTDVPLLIIWEGMSMYFEEDEVQDILKGIGPLMSHPDSLLWVDLIDKAPVLRPERYPASVQNFMRGMQILGEPFTFGTDKPSEFLADAGLKCLETVSSDVFFPEGEDPVFSIYRFCTATSNTTSSKTIPRTFKKNKVDRASSVVREPHFSIQNQASTK